MQPDPSFLDLLAMHWPLLLVPINVLLGILLFAFDWELFIVWLDRAMNWGKRP